MVDITDSELKQLSEYIHKKYGIYLKEQKRTLVTGRLSSVLEKYGCGSFSEYFTHIKNDPTGEAERTLVNQITTNYTYFMREPAHFHYLRDTVLPILESGIKDCDLRIWSAGCSSGEEAYTLAFILDEYFKDKSWWDRKVLATDISEKALGKARHGVYEKTHLADLPPQWRMDYFDRVDDTSMAVKDAIKKQVIFAPLNLVGQPFNFKRQFHVIMCRNVMIYFDQKTKVELVNRFYDITAPGGYLFIGHTESIASWESKYRYVMPALYRKI
ncbi:MAG TPA: protein-glutamate O-methyltransferase CheR [Candidatus Acidoferrum sp.]|nr:protein-glutamate O-methyltransferase CheR [Candidatus Acidoferrum sp.]